MVKRIVANIAAKDIKAAQHFYGAMLGLDLLMDHGWIRTYGSDQQMSVQLSIATEGGSGTPVPGLSIEVEALDEVYEQCVQAGYSVVYGPVAEPWGVRRFYVLDPFGTCVNILEHLPG